MVANRSDRFVFNLSDENNEYWRRSLRLAAHRASTPANTDTSLSQNVVQSPRKKIGFGADYQEALEEVLMPSKLSFSLKPQTRSSDSARRKLDGYFEERRSQINVEPSSVLDAPGLRDDYYLNILDWSAQNLLAVALNESIYVWDPALGTVQLLSQVSGPLDYISSLVFSADGSILSMASSQGCLSSFDMNGGKKIQDFTLKHSGRIATMAMCPTGSTGADNCLTVGSKSGSIFHFDPRNSCRTPVLRLQEHTLEVCGLKRSFDVHQLASGGNDNKVCIWDLRWPSEPMWVQEDHLAAVKALDWCPWQSNLLATGSGTADRRIRFWNTMSNTCQREIQCDSQVCGLRWSANHAEIVSTHGFGTNELALWHYPSLNKITGFKAHESRVLQVAMSPDATTVVTAAANEHLKFWDLFPPKPSLRRPKMLE